MKEVKRERQNDEMRQFEEMLFQRYKMVPKDMGTYAARKTTQRRSTFRFKIGVSRVLWEFGGAMLVMNIFGVKTLRNLLLQRQRSHQ